MKKKAARSTAGLAGEAGGQLTVDMLPDSILIHVADEAAGKQNVNIQYLLSGQALLEAAGRMQGSQLSRGIPSILPQWAFLDQHPICWTKFHLPPTGKKKQQKKRKK